MNICSNKIPCFGVGWVFWQKITIIQCNIDEKFKVYHNTGVKYIYWHYYQIIIFQYVSGLITTPSLTRLSTFL